MQGRHRGKTPTVVTSVIIAVALSYFAKSRQDLGLGGLASHGGPVMPETYPDDPNLISLQQFLLAV